MRLLSLAAVGVTALLPLAACERPARIALEPQSVRLYGKGQSLQIHANAFAKNGRPLPQEICQWSSSDEKVATITGPHNDATITAVGTGSAIARCTISGIVAEAQVVVRMIVKVEASPKNVELKMLDQPEPVALEVRAYDGEGRLMSGRPILARCLDENVCRGDGRGQLWAVGPGESKVSVEVDEAKAEITARVIDARTAEGKPKHVTGNPMLIYEKAYEELQKLQKNKK